MDMNIVTDADLQAAAAAGPPPGAAGAPAPPAAAAPAPAARGDDYWKKLRKYVPAETIGAYLLIDSLFLEIYEDDLTPLRWTLIVGAVVFAALTWVATRTLLGITRPDQRAIAVLAFGVWVFAGGTLFTTYDWYRSGFGVVAVVAFGAIAAVFRLKPVNP